MCTRRNKGMVQNSVILGLIVCIGYGFYMYSLLQNRVKYMDSKVVHQRAQHETLSSQMQVAYEDKARLEKDLQKLKTDCQTERERKEELIQGMLVEHQDKNGVLVEAKKKLEEENAETSKELKVLKIRYDTLHKEHEKLKIKHADSVKSFSENANNAYEDLQICEAEQGRLKTKVANLENQLENTDANHQKIVASMKIIPVDAINFNHPALKDISDSEKNYIAGLVGESKQYLVQEQKDKVVQHPTDPVVPEEADRHEEADKQAPESDQNSIKEVQLNTDEKAENAPKAPANQGEVEAQVAHAESQKEIPTQRRDDNADIRLDNDRLPAENMDEPQQQDGNLGRKDENDIVGRSNDDVDDQREQRSNEADGINEVDPDDPSRDLGGPIGDDVVHDLGDKEEGDGIHDVGEADQPRLDNDEAKEDGDEHEEENEKDEDDFHGADMDAPIENDGLQIDDGENDIHDAIVQGEEGRDEKDNVQVVLPPAARVSDDELEVAVNAPPDQNRVEHADDEPRNDGKGADDYNGYERENYEREPGNEDDNGIDRDKVNGDYRDEDESEEEKEEREMRNSRREGFDKNFETLKEARDRMPHGGNL